MRYNSKTLEMELTLDQALQKGIEAHKAGKAQEADKYYTAILKANPKHPDANHNMGALAVGVGNVEAALPFFKTALEVNQTIGQYWLSYINALIKLDRLDDAKEVLNKAKSNGAKGDAFDQLENQLGLSPSKNSNVQEPPQEQLQSLIDLHTQGQYQDALTQSLKLLEQFPSSINLYNIIGAIYKGLERLEESVEAYKNVILINPNYPDAYNNMGIALKNQGKLVEALEAYTKALSIKPDYADGYNNMGIVLKEQGKLDEAIVAYKKALSIRPDLAEAYNNMGIALKNQRKLDEAIVAYKKALSIKPDYAEAYNNMGNALRDQSKLKEAIEAYNKVISISPKFADAYNNMGIALKDQGKLDEAIEAYSKAISIRPDYAEAYKNLGVSFKQHGKLVNAIEAYNKAISIQPDFTEAYYNMGIALKGTIFSKPNRDLQKTIVSLLDKETYVRPVDIEKAVISLLKLEPTLQKHLQLTDSHVIENPLDVISDLHEFPLLMKLMRVCPLIDLELEGLFTKLRFSILSNISSLKEISPKLIKFQSALALQCFTNEYIYNDTGEEEKRLHSLDAGIKKTIKNEEQPNPQVILALASYKALNQYDWSNLLVVNDHIKEVFTRQVEEPNHEEELKQDLQILEEITNSISLKVREQYEESPYPRWVNLGLPLKPLSISNVVDQIKLKLHDNKITGVEKPEILVAGCGTGQHSIQTAARFKSSKVLAIDLSLSSLAYAKRKTKDLGIENISYMQADILDLGKLNKQFDIIESAGVLHHMDDPIAGWKVLTDCLKPGGLMMIGLYSELARKHIVKMRQEISKAGIGSSDAAIKSFREMVMKSNEDHHTLITTSPDFYSLSTLKDLLFHVQEHRFTIPQLKDYFDELGLKFRSFEMQTVSNFEKTNKAKDALYDLDKWHAYEEANPRAFAGMYQFWCEKVG